MDAISVCYKVSGYKGEVFDEVRKVFLLISIVLLPFILSKMCRKYPTMNGLEKLMGHSVAISDSTTG